MSPTKILYITIVLFSGLCFSSCSKKIEKKPAGNTSDTTIVVTPGGNGGGTGTTSGNAYIKFFNVLYDYNAVTCFLNGVSAASVSDFFPSGYITIPGSQNEITLYYPTTATKILDISATLTGGNYYSCFIYKVGYDWKVSIVNDNLKLPSAGYFKVRILDFRTQAYFDYAKTRIYSPGNVSELDQTGRHFLDHTTYDSYTRFDSLPSGKYSVMTYNDTVTLARKDYSFVAGKTYSVLLTTATNQTSAEALFKIQTDIEAHN